MFRKHLPLGIFVKVFEERLDLLQVVILGPDRTPYFLNLFAFDIFLPPRYPQVPPLVHYQSYGYRLNPNLYEEGKVCLSLLNTWSGKSTQVWTETSNQMQVFVSLQGLVLGQSEPYFLEAGYEKQRGTTQGTRSSILYNESALISSLQQMQATYRRPPLLFQDLVRCHYHNIRDGLKQLQQAGILLRAQCSRSRSSSGDSDRSSSGSSSIDSSSGGSIDSSSSSSSSSGVGSSSGGSVGGSSGGEGSDATSCSASRQIDNSSREEVKKEEDPRDKEFWDLFAITTAEGFPSLGFFLAFERALDKTITALNNQ